MKTILLIFFGIFIGFTSFGQTDESAQYPNLFAQGLLNIPAQEMQVLQDEMRLNPFLEVVRLDHNSNRFFLLIKDLESLTNEELVTWFAEYGDFVTCIQIGVHGVDAVHAFPFVNCPN